MGWDDIKDGASLQDWLITKRKDYKRDAGELAFRTAMRCAPLFLSSPSGPYTKANSPTQNVRYRANLAFVHFQHLYATWAVEWDRTDALLLLQKLEKTSLTSRDTSFLAARHAAQVPLTISHDHSISNTVNSVHAAVNSLRNISGEKDPRATIWRQIRRDAWLLEGGQRLSNVKLWHFDIPDWFESRTARAKSWMQSDSPAWGPLINWFVGVAGGDSHEAKKWIPEPEFIKVSTFDEFEQLHAMRDILEPSHPPEASKTKIGFSADEVLGSALSRFTFVELRRLMKMVPFTEDFVNLQQPGARLAFSKAAGDVRRSLSVLQSAFSAEGGRLQGAGAIAEYIKAVEAELEVTPISEMRIGWVVECGEILHGFASSPTVTQELGLLSGPLRVAVDRLLFLCKDYFANTLLRFAPLKELRSDPETRVSDLLRDLRSAVSALKQETGEKRVPLAPEDLVVFDALLDEIDRVAREEFLAQAPNQRSSLRKEIDFRVAQVSVSLLLYLEEAPTKAKKVKQIAELLSSLGTGYGTLERIVKGLLEFIK